MTERYDLLGIGFGPAGLATAAAIADAREADGASAFGRVLFLERERDTVWQRGMLIRETDIQHHYFRDLATPRDPRSRFTFANYLKEHDRIYEFGNLVYGTSGGAVSRLEWADYLRWAAGLLRDYVEYGANVTDVAPDAAGFTVTLAGGRRLHARDVVVACGRRPYVPAELAPHLGSTLFHSFEFAGRAAALDRAAPLRFAVIGSGQNAAEVIGYLHDHFPASTITSVHRSVAFRQLDLGHFSNEVFFPAEVDYFHALERPQRAAELASLRYTNYGAIDEQAADRIYRKIYEDRVLGTVRVRFAIRSRIESVAREASAYRIELAEINTGARRTLTADVVVACTGFTEDALPAFLGSSRELIALDDDGAPVLDRDYRVRLRAASAGRLFFTGITERTHGLSDSTSFSMMALKAERLVRAVAERSSAAVPA
ncbi:MAG: hypothetical protein JWM87_3439 [Candidatus Eremiobacteraeota bacterium]|nr:hypothetical protein [Candidatus Eremiobacteraeota bacterium]